MASVKPDPPVPKVDAPGEYRIRRLHRDGSRGIARFELVGKEGVDNVQRAEKARQRCTENDENLNGARESVNAGSSPLPGLALLVADDGVRGSQ